MPYRDGDVDDEGAVILAGGKLEEGSVAASLAVKANATFMMNKADAKVHTPVRAWHTCC